MEEITAKVPKMDKEWNGTYDFGSNLEEAVAKFGGEVVYTNFVANSTVRLQAIVRDLIEKGKSDAEIQAEVNAWKPGVQRGRVVDPVAAIKAKFGTMSPEEKAAFLADLSKM